MTPLLRRTAAWAIAAVLLGGASGARGAEKFEPKTLEIGASAPEFSLPGVDGETYTLADFKDAKVLVVVFTCNHCPTAQAYEGRIKQLYSDYKGKGVALVAISPNDDKALRLDELGYTDVSDSFAEMKVRAKDHGFEFPYLYDGETQGAAKAYGCQATPHVFVFDGERKLRYTGRIDDSDVKEPKSHETREAIEDLLAGRPVKVEKTHVFGCSTKWAYKREDVGAYLAKVDAEPVSVSAIDVEGVKKLVANEGEKLRVINFWATWCGPCLAEMPGFVEMNRMYRKRKFEMVSVSLDEPEKGKEVEEALVGVKASFTNYHFKGDRDLMMKGVDEKWEGPVPYTVVVAPGGNILYRHVGEVDGMEVKRVIVGYLGRTY